MHNNACPHCLSIGLITVGNNKLECGDCGAKYDIILDTPYLGSFTERDFISVLETTSFLHDYRLDEDGNIVSTQGGVPFNTKRNSYLNLQKMIDSSNDDEGSNVDWKMFGYEKKPNWFINRYNESVQFEQVVDGLDFKGKQLLDIGAGTGFDALRFHKKGAHVSALEYNPIQASIGNENFPEFSWLGGSVGQLPFPDETFDYVVANCALHHVLHLEDGLNEMLRVLKVGGEIITIGDSFSPTEFSEFDEATVFNSHQGVLRGVNEQLPQLHRYLTPFIDQKDAVEVTVMTPIVHGLHKNDGTLRHWDLKNAIEKLSDFRGGLCMRVFKRSKTENKDRPKTKAVVDPLSFAQSFSSRVNALSYLAKNAPIQFSNRPLLDEQSPKFNLLMGWKLPESESNCRQIFGIGHLFGSNDYFSNLLHSISLHVDPGNIAKSLDDEFYWVIEMNAQQIAKHVVDVSGWKPGPSVDLNAATPVDVQGLVSISMQDKFGNVVYQTFNVVSDT